MSALRWPRGRAALAREAVATGSTEVPFMARTSGLETSQHAITDVYDTQHGAFLVRYPQWLVISIAIAGVVAFGIAGFLGYGDKNTDVFAKPWALYVWFSALVITLLWSIFRHRTLRVQLIAVLIVAVICIVLAYLVGNPTGYIRKLLEQYLPLLAQEQLTYVVINFAIIIVFWVDTFRRWERRARGLRPHTVIDLATGKKIDTADPEELPSMGELISGDLIAGSVLTALLALLFQQQVISFVTQTKLSLCSVSLSIPPSDCVNGATNVVASLTLIDQTQALGYLALGMLVLAVAATMGGLGAIGGTQMPIGVSREVYAVLAEGNPPMTAPTTVGVAETVLDALRAAINRRLNSMLLSIVRGVRNIAWPVFLFVAMFGLYQLAQGVQTYLHIEHKTLTGGLLDLLPAVAWGAVSILTVVFSAALVVFRWRVVTNTMQFLGLNGLILLLTFWIFSLAMWGVNKLFEQFNPNVVRPFDPPLYLTAISFGALVIIGGYLVIRSGGFNFLPRQAARSQPTSGNLSPSRTTAQLSKPTIKPPTTPLPAEPTTTTQSITPTSTKE
jgi:hypothetical protein